MSEKVLMKGNEALAESAIRSGCHHFFGYPITPQTEVAAYMAKRLPKIGGVFLQAESEISAINMVLGAASTGTRVMTSSSSPGISLKTEGFLYGRVGLAGGYHQRAARRPRLGRHSAFAGRLLAGYPCSPGHGDLHILVFAPSTVQEMVVCVQSV